MIFMARSCKAVGLFAEIVAASTNFPAIAASAYGGGSKDYLSFSLIGMLLREGQIRRDEEIGRGRHVATVR